MSIMYLCDGSWYCLLVTGEGDNSNSWLLYLTYLVRRSLVLFLVATYIKAELQSIALPVRPIVLSSALRVGRVPVQWL